MSSWRYIAQRLTGDGAGEFIDFDLPLRGVQITDQLSGPPRITGSLSPEVARLVDSRGKPLLEEWSTAIYAEADNQIRGGGILSVSGFDGSSWSLDCVGFCGYPQGMPYTDSWYGVEIDPLDVVRHIWEHLQSKPNGNIGMVLSDLKTGLKIGTELEQVEFDTQAGEHVSFEAGPVKLNWYTTDDLGKEIDDLATETPFDYHERHYWSGDTIVHKLDFGYPRLGRRREDLRFVLGENIMLIPSVSIDGDEYANEVMALGAGEGRDMKRALVAKNDGRLRRVAVVDDKSLTTVDKATSLARKELNRRQGLADITEVTVRDHPHAEIGAWVVGDEIRVQGELGWQDIDVWCRVISSTISPEEGDAAQLTLLRSDKAGVA